MMSKHFFFLACVLYCLKDGKSQSGSLSGSKPVIGQKCPDFYFSEIEGYKRNKASLNDFAGKWLILDFWGQGCSFCIKSMPKYDKYQREFKDKVSIVFVADIEGNNKKSLKYIYELTKVKNNLNLTVAYSDSLFENFGGQAYPYIVVIDPQGIIRAIDFDLKREDIIAMIEGRSFLEKINPQYDPTKPIFYQNNGVGFNELVYQSILARVPDNITERLIPEIRYARVNTKTEIGHVNMINRSMFQMYNLAFFGDGIIENSVFYDINSVYKGIILETKDSLLFKMKRWDSLPKFSYSLKLPEDWLNSKNPFHKNTRAMRIMQHELENYFGYKALMEKRACPYLRLVSDSVTIAAIKTKGGSRKYEPFNSFQATVGTWPNFRIQNAPIEFLLDQINGCSPDNLVVINETGFTGNIDIKIDAITNDFEGIRKELAKKGLYLVAGTKEMKALVIRDPEPKEEWFKK